jgi:hypothetical protein
LQVSLNVFLQRCLQPFRHGGAFAVEQPHQKVQRVSAQLNLGHPPVSRIQLDREFSPAFLQSLRAGFLQLAFEDRNGRLPFTKKAFALIGTAFESFNVLRQNVWPRGVHFFLACFNAHFQRIPLSLGRQSILVYVRLFRLALWCRDQPKQRIAFSFGTLTLCLHRRQGDLCIPCRGYCCLKGRPWLQFVA